MRYGMILGLMVVSLGAQAADGPWTPAPVPRVGDPTIQPAARTGSGMAPATVDTPFSAMPLGSIGDNGSASSNITNSVKTPDLSGN